MNWNLSVVYTKYACYRHLNPDEEMKKRFGANVVRPERRFVQNLLESRGLNLDIYQMHFPLHYFAYFPS